MLIEMSTQAAAADHISPGMRLQRRLLYLSWTSAGDGGRMGVRRNWPWPKKAKNRVFLSGLGGTQTYVVSMQCSRKGPGARRPRSRPVSRLMDRSVFLHRRGWGGWGVSSLFCFLFKTSQVTRHSVEMRLI